jgi:CheY-like chemotaxis protein
MSEDKLAPLIQEANELMARVLVVDDEKSIRLTLKEFLDEGGYEVEMAEDADVASQLLEDGAFDVVVSDIILPRVNGVQLLQKIRKRPVNPIFRVFLSVSDNTGIARGGLGWRILSRGGASEVRCGPVSKGASMYRRKPRAVCLSRIIVLLTV